MILGHSDPLGGAILYLLPPIAPAEIRMVKKDWNCNCCKPFLELDADERRRTWRVTSPRSPALVRVPYIICHIICRVMEVPLTPLSSCWTSAQHRSPAR